ncbi:hypothetical protein DM860_013599 [Cuscuta australis]|uniref:Uncharacterized protein n=1 Tax=Cuscuta australis TaxID=267555 RepID=A0A328EEA9_9ASTE|nr:hypothetical protein DM860_013599 [Cuscuta australis]
MVCGFWEGRRGFEGLGFWDVTVGSLRSAVMMDKEEELALFNEMRRREKVGDGELLLLEKSDEFDALLGSKDGSSSILNGGGRACMPAPTTVADDFLYSENDKNDYEWLLTPPGTPLFPSLEMESQKTVMSQLGSLKPRPTALKSGPANPLEATVRSNLTSRKPQSSSPELTTSTPSIRRPSSSSSSRPSTPTNRSTLNNPTKPELNTTMSKTSTSTRPTRSSTPTHGPVASSTKTTVAPRSSTPTRQPIPGSKPISSYKPTPRAATPTRRPSSSSIAIKPSTTPTKNSSSPDVNPVPTKASDIRRVSADAPPNLMTSLPQDRPPSATRGRPRIPVPRFSSIEPVGTGKVRRQSCSPARGRLPNRTTVHGSGSSVPILAMSRLHAKANDNVSPVVVGAKMVERVVSMRKLAPPRQDNEKSPNSNLSSKSPSLESSGFGRNLSKKSLDMAIRHMDIRRTVPSNLRPLAAKIPASSVHSVRTRPTGRGMTVSKSDSPSHATSNNNDCSEVSANEVGDDNI